MANKHNFGAGPGVLPKSVMEKAAKAVENLNGSGLSILEISHRSQAFTEIIENAISNFKKIAGVGDDYDVLLLQGGATLQFAMLPMNLAKYDEKTAYVDSGAWSAKAIKEAELLTQVEVVASSKEQGYKSIPKGYSVPNDAAYLHITSNNTIYGTQFHDFPEVSIPLVADMSSDILCRPIDFNRFGLVYAGAQKNLGPAGLGVVLIKKDLLGRSQRKLPSYLDYSIHAKQGSLYNTPPVFSVYVFGLVLEWILEIGGLEKMEERNLQKAQLLYDEIDRNSLFQAVAAKEDRSIMNATFTLSDESKKDRFKALIDEAGIVGLNGHRSVGGYRASMYNALELDSVKVLVEIMKTLES